MSAFRCLILCVSVHHGNTAKVARALAGPLSAEVLAPDEVPYTACNDVRLMGFGSGVFYGRMHPMLFEWLCGLPDAPGPAVPAFVFSTSGLPLLATLWHRSLKNLLARKGYEVVGEFACRGFDTWGPLWCVGGVNRAHPDERDLQRARAFGRSVAAIARGAGPGGSPGFAATRLPDR